jgi:hypothetical protein
LLHHFSCRRRQAVAKFFLEFKPLGNGIRFGKSRKVLFVENIRKPLPFNEFDFLGSCQFGEHEITDLRISKDRPTNRHFGGIDGLSRYGGQQNGNDKYISEWFHGYAY